MPRSLPKAPLRRTAFLLVLACAPLLAACAGDGPLKGVAEVAGFATTAQEAKPFVQETRPADASYVPVQSSIKREAVRMTPEEFKAIEAELEAKRASNEAAGVQAKQLGTQLPPPAPATVLPTN
jgi:hypothetical protein